MVGVKSSNGSTELLVSESYFSIERLPVPGGFLYVTRLLGSEDGSVAVSSTFVPVGVVDVRMDTETLQNLF